MNNLYRETVHKLCKVSLLHRYRISVALSGLKIYRGQPEILEYLSKNGDCSQKELADSLGVSPASIATSLKRMSKENFIERTPDKNDRRINRLRITEKGEKIRLEGRKNCDKVDKIMFSGFSDEEINSFSAMLSKICENLSGDGINEKDVMNFIKNRNGDDKND
ncbi:MAG: winged helix-turn-helix transcriptional regulator [Ruminococcaceae bacterium]|nr:winged helix-turn-helix transcriptional regulator [Oscillospiraceae bacterium]